MRPAKPAPRSYLAVTLALLMGTTSLAVGQDRRTPYPAMAPIGQYLMPDRAAEIALARSAAPAAISSHATVLVLGRAGYETAVEGDNGFVCLVLRSWMAPFASGEFWNARIRSPVCDNPQAARFTRPLVVRRTALALSGCSPAQIADSVSADLAKEVLPAPAPGAMTYMMSKEGYLGDPVGHWYPHLMFYVPLSDKAAWGADVDNSPVVLLDRFEGASGPIMVLGVPVRAWSDGTDAPSR